jgi:hypothetical protein
MSAIYNGWIISATKELDIVTDRAKVLSFYLIFFKMTNGEVKILMIHWKPLRIP